jgi:hypothetical protein
VTNWHVQKKRACEKWEEESVNSEGHCHTAVIILECTGLPCVFALWWRCSADVTPAHCLGTDNPNQPVANDVLFSSLLHNWIWSGLFGTKFGAINTWKRGHVGGGESANTRLDLPNEKGGTRVAAHSLAILALLRTTVRQYITVMESFPVLHPSFYIWRLGQPSLLKNELNCLF